MSEEVGRRIPVLASLFPTLEYCERPDCKMQYSMLTWTVDPKNDRALGQCACGAAYVVKPMFISVLRIDP